MTYTRTDSGDIARKVDSWQPLGVSSPSTTTFNYVGDRLMSTRTVRQVLVGNQTQDSSFGYDDLGSVLAIKSHTACTS